MDNKLAPVPWIYSPVKLKVHPVNDDRMTVCYFNSYESDPNISERNSFGYLIAAAPDLLKVCEEMQWLLTNLIHITPSGENRDTLTDYNIKVLAVLNKALNK